MSSDSHHLVSIDDLPLETVDALVARARELDASDRTQVSSGFEMALVFLSSSLRTRVGFSVAAGRLGGRSIDVHEARWSESMSSAESLEDTIRTVSGMVDLVVFRGDVDLRTRPLQHSAVCPFVNAGDAGEHPTQALIDCWSIIEERGPVEELSVAMVGDQTMRAARSLIRLFGRRPPARLQLIAPESRRHPGFEVTPELRAVTSSSGAEAMAALDADVVYVVGLAPGRGDARIDDAERARYRVSRSTLDTMGDDAVVLCPLPVIDEIDSEARNDPRMRFWEQNDRSVAMRMAVIEHVLARR